MILSALRERTREQHQRLEQAVDLPGRLTSRGAYTILLERFYGLYQPLEARLSAHRQLELSGIAAERLEKHILLERDLRTLGRTTAAIDSLRKCTLIPELPDLYSAAGCLYVLEGATLGGQIVRREVDARLDLAPPEGCLFFSSYGPRVREMWNVFCGRLTDLAQSDPESGPAIVKGAAETFTCFEEWLR
jgi:heme oxygenase